ncbi:alcohol dehydrogenase [Porifericola rhodea]|uniref:alcohol dehydrogenase n=1 Tax=Porifericola rhodea TaxID=930972 RepID=UPI002665470B|nr:alcohol dehydrogenase [Porifericola rhodea]WKN30659.1 alcohol dehydrogenase [Porifericola rhodea]
MMKAMIIKEAGGSFESIERDIPKPKEYEVLIKVQACGICHSDMFVKEGAFPGIEYPRIPGHEVIGTIEEIGGNVSPWEKGQRVGVGWHGGHCFTCDPCRKGDFINCQNAQIAGISYDGGYATHMLAPQEALARIPDSLSSEEAAPILCAGITVFNAMRNADIFAGDLVAVQGLGGLGHLAIQYAAKMGMHTVAISSSDDKKELAHQLGAHEFINGKAENAAEALQKMGGAKLILATAPNSKLISSVVAGLGPNGQLLIVGADTDPMQISPLQLITGKKTVSGWSSGTAKDSEETLKFSALTKSIPMIEKYPLEKAAEAYERMINNEARFRVVLTVN